MVNTVDLKSIPYWVTGSSPVVSIEINYFYLKINMFYYYVEKRLFTVNIFFIFNLTAKKL
jgi:hypothetical protein